MAPLSKYWVFLGRQCQPFPCPLCNETVLPKAFENHCLSHHHLNPKLSCVWCRGNVSWGTRQKKNHVNHLMICVKHFLNHNVESCQPTPDTTPVPFDLTPMDPKRHLFDHVFDPPPRAYDTFCPLPLDSIPIPFQTESLNRAAACVRTYLRLRDATEWYHVMVRTLAFSAFVEALDPEHTQTLPFSCWCDGGQPKVARFRQHRHFILVSSPPGYFKTWIQTVRPEERPTRNFRCLLSKHVLSVRHLVNLIGYLCKRESECAFTGDDTKTTEKLNHFYLFEELPKAYRLPLVLQWNGGLDELLHQTYRNFKRSELVQAALFFGKGKWHLHIRDIPGISLGTVVPVARDYRPCERETESFFHLVGGRKLYFERNPGPAESDPETWLHTQADAGNMFYRVVGRDAWTPRPYHQGLIREFKPLVDRNRELETSLAQASEEKRALEKELAQLKETLVEERTKIRESLERDLHYYKKKCEALEQEIKRMNEKLNRLQEGENARLRREIEELKKILKAGPTHKA